MNQADTNPPLRCISPDLCSAEGKRAREPVKQGEKTLMKWNRSYIN